jgi:hypothetical protein
MNETTLVQLQIIVERAVRPVRASMGRKHRMREELLSHISGVFDEESARLGDEKSALEATALRFGNAAEVTSQLQESIPRGDAFRRFWEGRPGEPASRTAVRLAWFTGAFGLLVAVFILVAASFKVGWSHAWPPEVLIICFGAVLAMPVYLAGLTFLTDWMEKALYGPAGCSRLKIRIVGGASCLFTLLWFAALVWPTWSGGWDSLGVVLVGGWLGLLAPSFPYTLAQSSHEQKCRHQEWAKLDIA